jgi:hypothetical protein
MTSTLSLLLFFIPFLPVAEDAKLLPPGITQEKAAEGWIALFDGETDYGLKIDGGFKIDKGVLILNGGSSLSTMAHFAAFELAMEHKYDRKSGAFTLQYADGSVGKKWKSSEEGAPFAPFAMSVPNAKKTGPIKITVDAESTMHIKSLTLRPLGAESIFNGKDLTGWKEIPDKKSKYSVTPAGELNVKDGNGDIQTEGQWDDFVLQLDVISNGDHLNSGVFFRCVPGQFWSGYEAQVRNEWERSITLKDGRTFRGSCLEKGDEVEMRVGRTTHKFPKAEIETKTDHRDKPIDFGSGGIYNYCKARRVVSTDREYFTMTVIAHGNQMAVWVNGYQTAEYTDNRANNASARRGRKDGAGSISLQGHDPTTDLSFKNIRVAPLPKVTP